MIPFLLALAAAGQAGAAPAEAGAAAAPGLEHPSAGQSSAWAALAFPVEDRSSWVNVEASTWSLARTDTPITLTPPMIPVYARVRIDPLGFDNDAGLAWSVGAGYNGHYWALGAVWGKNGSSSGVGGQYAFTREGLGGLGIDLRLGAVDGLRGDLRWTLWGVRETFNGRVSKTALTGVHFTGRTPIVAWCSGRLDAILLSWQPGSAPGLLLTGGAELWVPTKRRHVGLNLGGGIVLNNGYGGAVPVWVIGVLGRI